MTAQKSWHPSHIKNTHKHRPIGVAEDHTSHITQSAGVDRRLLPSGVSGALDVNEVDLPAVVSEEVSQVFGYKDLVIPSEKPVNASADRNRAIPSPGRPEKDCRCKPLPPERCV